ncbi:2Fe-2S iron-sulfur cluster-binding protein [Arthrobacter sp. efr-133-TYG-120]|uniref:2Fe-2S iron-sulfur cluster-binding protein n=1 Tax=Arthrobacter sp. efr-133-TYG-120 TaxID=3040280 RepID=UPI00254F5148|nr:2Fe-2S iron-sulfur cluster-binding protein [Arthrobacter sp. efr-133-TYG-120]
MPTITFVQPTGHSDTVTVSEKTSSLMRAAVANGVEGIVGECGGQAMCATCHVYIRPEFEDALPEISEDEDEMLDCTTAERTNRSRLGCQVSVGAHLETIIVDVPTDQV